MEYPKLRLIHCATRVSDNDILHRRIQRIFSDYPIECVEPLLEAMVDYIAQLETDVHSDAIYIKLHDALYLWSAMDD